MSWNSGECRDPEPEPLRRPRMVWGQATHYAGIVDTVNPGHWPDLTDWTTVDAPDANTLGGNDVQGTE